MFCLDLQLVGASLDRIIHLPTRSDPEVLEMKYIQVKPGKTQPRPQGFSLKKKGGAGKGPGIGWSPVKPKYSEKLIYMQPAGFALTEGSNNGK